MATQGKYERDTQRLDFIGLDLNRPVDSLKPGKLPYALNIRSYIAGRIEPRDGMVDTASGQVVPGQSPTHSCRRLNDSIPADSAHPWTRVVGVGTHVAYGQGPYTDLDSGYSGDPLALVPWRPIASPKSFMYIGDSARMRKVSTGGDLHPIGLPMPQNSSTAQLSVPTVVMTGPPNYKDVDPLTSSTGWTSGPTVENKSSGLTQFSRTPGNNNIAGTTTTIAQIYYDTGSAPGWASLQLNAAGLSSVQLAGMTRGQKLSFATNSEASFTPYVQDVYPGNASVNLTIGAIQYDSGTSGDCSMTLSSALVKEAQVFALLRNTTHSENFLVKGRFDNPDGTFSIRTTTVATFSAGDTITVLPSCRMYLHFTHAAGENVSCDGIFWTNNKGLNMVSKYSGVSLDLTQIGTGVPMKPDDYFSIAIILDRPDLLTDMKLVLNVDPDDTPNSTGHALAYARNYYWYDIRPSDLTPSTSNLQSLMATRQTIIQNNIINSPQNVGDLSNVALANEIASGKFVDPALAAKLPAVYTEVNNLNQAITGQLAPGISSWNEVRFHLSDLMRVGGNQSLSLQNVIGLQFVVISTGQISMGVNSWWIGGGYGPDTNDTASTPYYYRYRARVQSTNVPSAWSPASRFSMTPYRQSVTVSMPQYTVPAGTTLNNANDILLDIFRYGGQIAEWHYVGTIPNAASPSLLDIYPDSTVGGNPIQSFTDFQPWPYIGLPVKSTTSANVTVVGTSVVDTTNPGGGFTGLFNLNWSPGTRIVINNQPYTIYRVNTQNFLEIVESAGSQTNISWHVDEPTILYGENTNAPGNATGFPVLWEWDGNFFACGDPVNPGRLYWSNPDSETTDPSNWLDMTSPSEPLMNGLQYNTRSYVISTESFIQILKTGDPSEPFRHEHIPNGKGLYFRWAITLMPSPVICYLSKDGLMMTNGGSPTSLTDADLYDLFPNEGNPGVNVNGISAPVLQRTTSRLTMYDDYLYFDYSALNGIQIVTRTLVLAFDLGAAQRGEAPGGWLYDIYTPNVDFHYGEEGPGVHQLLLGSVDGHLFTYSGNNDAGANITMEFTTPSRDQGDPRSNKYYGDVMMDTATSSVVVSATPFFNNNALAGPTTTYSNAAATRGQTVIPCTNFLGWQTALNISIFNTCQVTNANRPFFYIWESRWTFESAPISALSWNISPTTFGKKNFLHIGLCKICHVSTVDLALTFFVDGVAQPIIQIPNSGGIYLERIFRVPVMKGKVWQIYIATSDGVTPFRLNTRDTYIELKEWASDNAYDEPRIWSDFAMVEG